MPIYHWLGRGGVDADKGWILTYDPDTNVGSWSDGLATDHLDSIIDYWLGNGDLVLCDPALTLTEGL